jgi:glycerol-3-phosphate dehydrogenase (NAD(P)+)
MTDKQFNHFGIIGAGAWGTALAATLMRAGRRATLCARDPALANSINVTHENAHYLEGITLDAALQATATIDDLAGCDAWILACPAQHVRDMTQKLAALGHQQQPIIIAAKGIEQNTSLMMGDVVASTLPQHPLAVLSGPSFAAEVARGLPTALTLATRDAVLGKNLIAAMATSSFRLYQTDDVIGAEIGGAVKNILAIACGIITGKKFGENARAALVTRGLAEMVRLGLAAGARMETLMGLSGLGDLMLTCSSSQSRNMSLGLALGEGQTLAAILATRITVTEGVTTAKAALCLANRYGVNMPIVAAVDSVLSGTVPIDTAITALLARPLRSEGV